jgi:hypothetical protein
MLVLAGACQGSWQGFHAVFLEAAARASNRTLQRFPVLGLTH